jgi:conjugal transfer/entry exclusion protein
MQPCLPPKHKEEPVKKRRLVFLPTVVAAALVAAPAHAGIPVFDALNFTSNVIQNFQLLGIKKSLTEKSKGTVVYNTNNIDNSTRNIDKSTYNIDKTTNNILKYTEKNYNINTSLTWIINKGGDEVIPIPEDLEKLLAAISGSGDPSGYTGHFQDASAYTKDSAEPVPSEILEGSRVRKAANDMLVNAIEIEKKSMKSEASGLTEVMDKAIKAEGHGQQLQIANALAASQISQMMKLRSSMLVAEAQRAADSQVAADKDARAIATASNMRAGLSTVIATSPGLKPAR